MVAAAAQEEGDEPWWAAFDDENASPQSLNTKQQLLQACLDNKNPEMQARYVQSGILDLLKDLSTNSSTSKGKSALELLQALHKALHPPSHSPSTGEMTIAALVLHNKDDTLLQLEAMDEDELEFLPDAMVWHTMVTWLLQLYEHCKTSESSSEFSPRPFKRARLSSSGNATSHKIQSNNHTMRWKLGLTYAIASMIYSKKDPTDNYLQEWMDHVRTLFSQHLALIGPHMITAGVALAAWQHAETGTHNIPLSQLVPLLTRSR